jgi:hypothetical protein
MFNVSLKQNNTGYTSPTWGQLLSYFLISKNKKIKKVSELTIFILVLLLFDIFLKKIKIVFFFIYSNDHFLLNIWSLLYNFNFFKIPNKRRTKIKIIALETFLIFNFFFKKNWSFNPCSLGRVDLEEEYEEKTWKKKLRYEDLRIKNN